jgi:predicted unusual protein kinase regulating ubiquinone biosynthesis (AarF/ABC1/UbiB family)
MVFILKNIWLQSQHKRKKNKIGQKLWNLYDFQVNNVRAIHADPHPGNFIIQKDGNIGLIDFGCVKQIPDDFYYKYFQLLDAKRVNDDESLRELFFELEFIFRDESKANQDLFFDVFKNSMSLLIRPFLRETFDFSDQKYFDELYAMGDELKNRKDLRKNGMARGSKHLLYINRTYFGLFSLLNELGATINTTTSFDFSKTEKTL